MSFLIQFLGSQQENEQLLKFAPNFFQYLLSVVLDSDQWEQLLNVLKISFCYFLAGVFSFLFCFL